MTKNYIKIGPLLRVVIPASEARRESFCKLRQIPDTLE